MTWYSWHSGSWLGRISGLIKTRRASRSVTPCHKSNLFTDSLVGSTNRTGNVWRVVGGEVIKTETEPLRRVPEPDQESDTSTETVRDLTSVTRSVSLVVFLLGLHDLLFHKNPGTKYISESYQPHLPHLSDVSLSSRIRSLLKRTVRLLNLNIRHRIPVVCFRTFFSYGTSRGLRSSFIRPGCGPKY